MTNLDLFPDYYSDQCESIGTNAWVLRGYALPYAEELLNSINTLEIEAPFRHMKTPGGFRMSVALTNCGQLGWNTDCNGYCYSPIDPLSGKAWPNMPVIFQYLAREAALMVGFENFAPDSCLINRYAPCTKLSLHQDRNERDFSSPIVSVSLGMPATFMFGGSKRSDPTLKIPLLHGDVAVWGGQDRLRYHGIAPIKSNPHPLMGNQRINLTFRKAG